MKQLIALFITNLLYLSASIAALPAHYMAVANKSDSSISLIDTKSNQVVLQITEATVGYKFEPMYASHIKPAKVFVVGDRKNNELMVFDDASGVLLKRVPLSKGVFHQWVKPGDSTVVLATDDEKGADVIRLSRKSNGKIIVHKKRFKLKGQYAGGTPHDVVIDDHYFYLTINTTDKFENSIDKVLKVRRKDLKVVADHQFSMDVHVGLPQNSAYLLVAEQSGTLNFLTRSNMTIVKKVEHLPGTHGLFWTPDATRIFSANVTSKGPNSLYDIKNKQFGPSSLTSVLDTGFSKPHNISVDFTHGMLYITHSGMNDQVSVFDINGKPVLIGSIQTGANPFGIGFIKR